MKKIVKITSLLLVFLLALSLSACKPVDSSYGVENETVKSSAENAKPPKIMSSDLVMTNYFDISLFDEENYANIYFGKKFKFKVTVAGHQFTVPTTYEKVVENGWTLAAKDLSYEKSDLYAGGWIELQLENTNGKKITALFYNSSNSSKPLIKCNIVKFKIVNDFYNNQQNFTEFNVNGVNNGMAIIEVINTLGTPSHFYRTAEDNYYLDYFISKDDRRNGITVYINPVADTITAIEFSYYK